ncbi:MAG: D-alanyl-D-alanine carboxypeptidase/D-alanyl-D-alanine endopeptidase [Chitinophagaceae bacterium]
MSISKIFLCCMLFATFLIACSSNKQLATTKDSTLRSTVNTNITSVNEELPSILNDSALKSAHIGICVYSPATKSFIQNYQGDKYFIPASNIKIATCYAAMKYLGDSIIGIKFKEDDENIYIQAAGDPTFLHKDFPVQKVFDLLNASSKKIILSDSKFTAKPLGKGWSWDDYQEPYMAERSAFPVNGNVVKFYYNENGYKTIPQYFEKFFSSQFQASDGNMKFSISRNYGNNSFFFDINPGKKEEDEITFNTSQSVNPTTAILEDILHKKVEKVAYRNLTKKIYSQATDSLLKYMMWNSDNLFAEQALLMVSNEKLGLMNDEKVIDTLLKSDFKNLPQKPRWVDGCGLSRYNLFTPQDFVFILNKMSDEFGISRIKNIFPTANAGTLKGYYKGLEGKLFAKTGSLSNNLSLSGFITTKSGKELVFSIIVNNHQSIPTQVRLAIEKYITQLITNN